MSFLSRKLIILLILIPVWANAQTILINEIAWMGTKEAWQDEWIELYNPNDYAVSIDGWAYSLCTDPGRGDGGFASLPSTGLFSDH